ALPPPMPDAPSPESNGSCSSRTGELPSIPGNSPSIGVMEPLGGTTCEPVGSATGSEVAAEPVMSGGTLTPDVPPERGEVGVVTDGALVARASRLDSEASAQATDNLAIHTIQSHEARRTISISISRIV